MGEENKRKDDGPLSTRGSGKTVARVNTERSQQRRNGGRNRGGNGQLSAEDLISLFQSMPVPNRGYKNPNAAQPAKMGGGLDWMDKNNSPDLVAQRQNQTDWAQGQTRDRARIAANSAVAEAKALNGYTDASGKFVPGMDKGPPTSAYGTGSVKQLAPGEKARGTMPHPITGEQVFMDDYLAGQEQVQNTKYGPGRDEFGGMKAGPSAAQAGLDYFNPQKMTMPTPVKSRPAPQTPAPLQSSNSSDLSGLFPGSAKLTDAPANVSLPPGHPLANEQPGGQSGSGYISSPYGNEGPVVPSWLQRKPGFPGVLPSVQSAIGQVPGIAGRALSGLGDFILGPEAARPEQPPIPPMEIPDSVKQLPLQQATPQTQAAPQAQVPPPIRPSVTNSAPVSPNASFKSFMPGLTSPQAAWESYASTMPQPANDIWAAPANQPSHLDQLIRLLFPGKPQPQTIPSNAPWSAYEDLLNTPLR